MQRYLILVAASILLGVVIFAPRVSAKDWVIFEEELPQGIALQGTIETTEKDQFEGDAALKYTGAGLAWAGVTGLNLDLSGITYDDAFLEFYATAEVVVTLEIKLFGPGGGPVMISRVHPQLAGADYEQIKIPLRHFVDSATAKIPKSLEDFTGGTSIVDQFMIAAGDGPVWIDNVRIADEEEREEQRSVSPSGKLATSWAKLKSRVSGDRS